jgi:hypothetical protein
VNETAIDLKHLIDSYGSAYDQLVKALEQFPREMWHYKAPDGWSVQEILIHIADSEANSYIRCRRAIAEPGSAVLGYDEMAWSQKLDYAQQSAEDALELFRLLRSMSYKLIRNLPEPVWQHTIEHSENGTMTLVDWLRVYERHVPEHIAQMQTNFQAWQQLGS